jgi:mannose-1-phosphate guanylyltransferase
MHPKDEEGNTVSGSVFTKDIRNCYISGQKEKIIAAIGCEDLIVIDTADALLICRAERSQEVKEVVDHLRRKQMNDYL